MESDRVLDAEDITPDNAVTESPLPSWTPQIGVPAGRFKHIFIKLWRPSVEELDQYRELLDKRDPQQLILGINTKEPSTPRLLIRGTCERCRIGRRGETCDLREPCAPCSKTPLLCKYGTTWSYMRKGNGKGIRSPRSKTNPECLLISPHASVEKTPASAAHSSAEIVAPSVFRRSQRIKKERFPGLTTSKWTYMDTTNDVSEEAEAQAFKDIDNLDCPNASLDDVSPQEEISTSQAKPRGKTPGERAGKSSKPISLATTSPKSRKQSSETFDNFTKNRLDHVCSTKPIVHWTSSIPLKKTVPSNRVGICSPYVWAESLDDLIAVIPEMDGSNGSIIMQHQGVHSLLFTRDTCFEPMDVLEEQVLRFSITRHQIVNKPNLSRKRRLSERVCAPDGSSSAIQHPDELPLQELSFADPNEHESPMDVAISAAMTSRRGHAVSMTSNGTSSISQQTLHGRLSLTQSDVFVPLPMEEISEEEKDVASELSSSDSFSSDEEQQVIKMFVLDVCGVPGDPSDIRALYQAMDAGTHIQVFMTSDCPLLPCNVKEDVGVVLLDFFKVTHIERKELGDSRSVGSICSIQLSFELTRTPMYGNHLDPIPWWSMTANYEVESKLKKLKEEKIVINALLADTGDQLRGAWWCHQCGRLSRRYRLRHWYCPSCGNIGPERPHVTVTTAEPKHWLKMEHVEASLYISREEEWLDEDTRLTVFSFLEGGQFSKLDIYNTDLLEWADQTFCLWQVRVPFEKNTLPPKPSDIFFEYLHTNSVPADQPWIDGALEFMLEHATLSGMISLKPPDSTFLAYVWAEAGTTQLTELLQPHWTPQANEPLLCLCLGCSLDFLLYKVRDVRLTNKEKIALEEAKKTPFSFRYSIGHGSMFLLNCSKENPIEIKVTRGGFSILLIARLAFTNIRATLLK